LSATTGDRQRGIGPKRKNHEGINGGLEVGKNPPINQERKQGKMRQW